MTIKLGFWRSLGGCTVCSLVKRVFLCIASYRAQLIVCPDLIFIQECVCACGCRKWERLISLCWQLSPRRSFFAGALSGFKVWGKTHFRRQYFCFYYMFKTNLSGHNKIMEGHKKPWGPCPRMPRPMARGLVLRTKVAFTLTRVKYIAL